jgi:hypothetical protein
MAAMVRTVVTARSVPKAEAPKTIGLALQDAEPVVVRVEIVVMLCPAPKVEAPMMSSPMRL